jgi:hypothetical protein
MRKRFVLTAVLVYGAAGMLMPLCFGQVADSGDTAISDAGAPQNNQPAAKESLPRFGLAVCAGTLGAGIQAATAVALHTNIRGGFNFFKLSVSGTDNKNDLGYSGTLRLASGEILVDQYLARGFHVSGGALIYDGFQATGNVQVPGGQTLTLNGVSYVSAASDPVTGTGAITVRKVAPELLIGFGNLLPRSVRHFTANFDLGAAFQGSPNTTLNLTGSTCVSQGCSAISSNPSVQANITAEQTKISNTLKPFQFYPVLRISFGYKF